MVICPNISDSIPFLSTQTKMDSFPVLSLILHLDSFPFQFLSSSKIQKKLSKIFPNSSKILTFHYRCLKCLLGNPCGLLQGKLLLISYENLRLLVLRYWSKKRFKAKIQAFFRPEEEFFLVKIIVIEVKKGKENVRQSTFPFPFLSTCPDKYYFPIPFQKNWTAFRKGKCCVPFLTMYGYL